MPAKLSGLVKQVKVAKSGLYALDNLEYLIKYTTVGTKAITDLIDTSDYSSTFTRLTDRLHIETDATMSLGIARIMNSIAANKDHLGLSDDALAYFHDNRAYIVDATDDYKKQIAIDAIEQGKGILAGITDSESFDEIMSMIAESNRAISEVGVIFNKKLSGINDKIRALNLLILEAQHNSNTDEFNRLWSDYESLRMDYKSTATEYDLSVKSPEMVAKIIGKKSINLHEKGKQAIDKLLEVSPITHEQATEWVARQKTPKNVYSALARKGYPTDKAKADMAEFYRLTHGKLKDVEIILGGAKRANAKDVASLLSGGVDLGSNPDKRVLFHELAHHLELDALAINLARGFLIKRRKSDKPVHLNKLSGRTGFGKDEFAYEDDFINPYVGKIYPESTEVFSMGVERLADPSKLMELVARDPEHAALILQYLGNESEVLNATKKLTSGVFNDISESNKKQANEYQTEIKRLASSIILVDDNPMGKFTRDDKWYIRGGLRIKESELDKSQYVGSIYRADTYIHIISGSFPDSKSKRLKKGFAVIVSPINQLPSAYAVHRDLDGVKALIYMTINGGRKGSEIILGLRISEDFLAESNINNIKKM